MDDLESFTESEKIQKLYYAIERKFFRLAIYMNELDSFVSEKYANIEGKNQNDSDAVEAEKALWSLDILTSLKTSYIMALFSAFETSIDDICEDIKKRNNVSLRRNDLTGGLITSFKKYLNCFSGFTKPNSDKWNILESIYQVRNIIVHGDGNIKKSKTGSMKKIRFLEDKKVGLYLAPVNHENAVWKYPEDMKEIKHSPLFYKEPKECIAITANFCDFSLNQISDFVKDLKDEHLKLAKGLRIV